MKKALILGVVLMFGFALVIGCGPSGEIWNSLYC